MRVAGWRAWYADGAIYGPGDELPPTDCVGFVLYYDAFAAPGVRYRDIVTSHDWYVLMPCGRVRVSGRRNNGRWGKKPAIAGDERLLKSAPTLPDDDWERLRAEMTEATEWP